MTYAVGNKVVISSAAGAEARAILPVVKRTARFLVAAAPRNDRLAVIRQIDALALQTSRAARQAKFVSFALPPALGCGVSQEHQLRNTTN